MKNKFTNRLGLALVLASVALGAAVTVPADAAPPLVMSRPLTVQATNEAPAVVGIVPSGKTNDLLQLKAGGTPKFTVRSNGLPSNVQIGTVVTTADSSVTQSFTITFPAAPAVLIRPRGVATTISNILTVTESNFVVKTGLPTQTNDYIVIGGL